MGENNELPAHLVMSEKATYFNIKLAGLLGPESKTVIPADFKKFFATFNIVSQIMEFQNVDVFQVAKNILYSKEERDAVKAAAKKIADGDDDENLLEQVKKISNSVVDEAIKFAYAKVRGTADVTVRKSRGAFCAGLIEYKKTKMMGQSELVFDKKAILKEGDDAASFYKDRNIIFTDHEGTPSPNYFKRRYGEDFNRFAYPVLALQFVPHVDTEMTQIYVALLAMKPDSSLPNGLIKTAGFQLYKAQYWEYETADKSIKKLARFTMMDSKKNDYVFENTLAHGCFFPQILPASPDALPSILDKYTSDEEDKKKWNAKYLDTLKQAYLATWTATGQYMATFMTKFGTTFLRKLHANPYELVFERQIVVFHEIQDAMDARKGFSGSGLPQTPKVSPYRQNKEAIRLYKRDLAAAIVELGDKELAALTVVLPSYLWCFEMPEEKFKTLLEEEDVESVSESDEEEEKKEEEPKAKKRDEKKEKKDKKKGDKKKSADTEPLIAPVMTTAYEMLKQQASTPLKRTATAAGAGLETIVMQETKKVKK